MKVPYRPTTFKKFVEKPKYVIIHNTNCKFYDLPNYRIDDKKSIINKMRSDYYVLYNETDLPFHYLIDKIQDDYEMVVGRSLRYHCEYKDIRQEMYKSIHIGIAGNMNFVRPTQRFYECMCYKVIAPLMIRFGIPFSNVYLHKDVTNLPDLKCPGDFFKKDIFLAILKRMLTIK